MASYLNPYKHKEYFYADTLTLLDLFNATSKKFINSYAGDTKL